MDDACLDPRRDGVGAQRGDVGLHLGTAAHAPELALDAFLAVVVVEVAGPEVAWEKLGGLPEANGRGGLVVESDPFECGKGKRDAGLEGVGRAFAGGL